MEIGNRIVWVGVCFFSTEAAIIDCCENVQGRLIISIVLSVRQFVYQTCKTTKLSAIFCGFVIPNSANSLFATDHADGELAIALLALPTWMWRGRVRMWKGGRSIHRDFIKSAKRLRNNQSKDGSTIPASTSWYLWLIGQ